MENTEMLPQEKKIVIELIKKNLASFNIRYGNITDSFVEILDSKGEKIVGNVGVPNIDSDSLYDDEECSKILANFIASAFKTQGVKIFQERLFFCEITPNNVDFSEHKAKNHRQLTDFVCGENFFCEGDCLERIDTRGDYSSFALEDFWCNFDCDSIILSELSNLKNISIAHYKGKFWEIHPTYHCGDSYIYTLEFCSRTEFLEALEGGVKKVLANYILPYDTAYYRYTADDSVVKEECDKARKIIEDTAYSLANCSGIDRVIECLFYNLETISDIKDELFILSKKLKNEKELGNLYFYAENLSSALLEEIFDSNFESLTLESVGTVNFVQKAREILSLLGGEFSLVLSDENVFVGCVSFQKVWKLVWNDCECNIDWQSFVFDTECAINDAISLLESYPIKQIS